MCNPTAVKTHVLKTTPAEAGTQAWVIWRLASALTHWALPCCPAAPHRVLVEQLRAVPVSPAAWRSSLFSGHIWFGIVVMRASQDGFDAPSLSVSWRNGVIEYCCFTVWGIVRLALSQRCGRTWQWVHDFWDLLCEAFNYCSSLSWYGSD